MGREALLGHDVPLPADSAWQRRARRLQSKWREQQGLRAGCHRGQPLESRLKPEDGEPPVLANYMNDAAKHQVLTAVEEARSTGALLSRPRLWVDFLSSQPLCFNAFADLAEDHHLASATMSGLLPDLVKRVSAVRFEFSPGRGSAVYTGNRSAFDVFIEASGPQGRGFIGIEVKYHEDMRVKAAPDRGYASLAQDAGVYKAEALPSLLRPPLQQLVLDYLLALRLAAAHPERWHWGHFAVLAPSRNAACQAVVGDYQEALADSTTFDTITLENFVEAMQASGASGLGEQLSQRYLGAAE